MLGVSSIGRLLEASAMVASNRRPIELSPSTYPSYGISGPISPLSNTKTREKPYRCLRNKSPAAKDMALQFPRAPKIQCWAQGPSPVRGPAKKKSLSAWDACPGLSTLKRGGVEGGRMLLEKYIAGTFFSQTPVRLFPGLGVA